MAGIPYWRLSAWYFFYFAFVGCFNPYFGLYLQSLGISAPGIGILLSLMNAMRIVAPGLWSLLGERLGALTAIRLAAAGGLLAFGGYFAARDFPALFAVGALLAFFATAPLPQVEALTLSHLNRRVERYGHIRLWGSVGFILAAQGVGLLLDVAPLTLLLWAGTGLLASLLVSSLALPQAVVPPSAPTLASFGALLRTPHVVALLAAGFLMSAAHAPLYVFYSIHLVDHGYDKTAVGALWSLGVIAEIVVFLGLSWLMRRFSLRAILSASFALAVIRFLLIGWAIDNPWAAAAAQLMHGATFGAHHAASVAAIHRWFASHQQTRALALHGSFSYGVGGVTGAWLSGYAWDALGAGVTYSLAAASAGVGLLLIWRGLRGH